MHCHRERGSCCLSAAGIAVVGGGLVLLLPETKGKTLPETIEDAENMHRYGASSTDQSSFPSLQQSPLVAIHHQKYRWGPDRTWPGQKVNATRHRTGGEEVVSRS